MDALSRECCLWVSATALLRSLSGLGRMETIQRWDAQRSGCSNRHRLVHPDTGVLRPSDDSRGYGVSGLRGLWNTRASYSIGKMIDSNLCFWNYCGVHREFLFYLCILEP